MVTSEDPQAEALRRLAPGERLAIAHSLWETAWSVTAAGVRLRDPQLTDAEITARVRTIFLRAVT